MISLSYEWRGDCDHPRRLAPIPGKTMLNIEKNSDGHKTTIRLIGRMQAEHLPALQALIKESRPRIALDLEQLTLVDVEAVRFLGGCRRNGMALLNCSPYIREWIAKEQKSGK
jgi:anti-anti-sigma regulatory factor